MFIFINSVLEAKLESEYEERTQLVREKHELECQILAMAHQAAHVDDDFMIQKLKRNLELHKVMMKNGHSQLERYRSETHSKLLLRELSY